MKNRGQESPRRRLNFNDNGPKKYDGAPLKEDQSNQPLSAATPPIRGSVSNHDSDSDRKLAQERFKNDKLTAHIQELEAQVSKLQMSQALDYNDDDRHNNDNDDSPYRFSSPPVTTPLKTPIRNGVDVGYDDEHMESLKEALKLEIKRSMAAEKKVADLLQQQQQQSKAATSFDIDIPANNIIRKLLERATNLILENDTHQSTNGTCNTSDNNTNTEEKMHEYYELVSAFCAEQESHSELDGEEMICRADVLWLLQELKWRYEEILNGYMNDESSRKKTSSQLDTSEWKECIKGLVDVLNKSIKATSSKDNQNTQNETSSLNQHDLESKLNEQKEYISQIQKDKQWIDEEKQRLRLNKDGTDARIRYLEGMLYSLQTQLKDSKQYQASGSPSRNNKAHEKKRLEKSPPPVYMRDLSHNIQDVDIGIHPETTPAKTKTSTVDATTKDNSIEITMLREQVVSLSASLAESETKRADLIEDFQIERKQYMTQYKQMSDLLKEIMAGKQS